MSGPVPPTVPWTYRPLGARLMAAAMAVVLVGVLAFLWVALPGSVRAQVTPFQRVTLLLVFGTMLAGLYGIARTAVRAERSGLRIVNVYRTRRLAWAQILTVRLQPGDPWAVLDVSDGTVLKVLAIQGSDGARARRGTRELRALVEQLSRPDG